MALLVFTHSLSLSLSLQRRRSGGLKNATFHKPFFRGRLKSASALGLLLIVSCSPAYSFIFCKLLSISFPSLTSPCPQGCTFRSPARSISASVHPSSSPLLHTLFLSRFSLVRLSEQLSCARGHQQSWLRDSRSISPVAPLADPALFLFYSRLGLLFIHGQRGRRRPHGRWSRRPQSVHCHHRHCRAHLERPCPVHPHLYPHPAHRTLGLGRRCRHHRYCMCTTTSHFT